MSTLINVPCEVGEVDRSHAPSSLDLDTGAYAVEMHQQRIIAQREEGVTCPCCGQFAKVYRRKFNSGQARALISMYREAGREWVHVPDIPGVSRIGGEFARMRFYGLIEESPHERPDGGRAGIWRLTDLGVAFVEGRATVPTYSILYNQELLRLEEPKISISQALGKRFRYDELMEGGSGESSESQP